MEKDKNNKDSFRRVKKKGIRMLKKCEMNKRMKTSKEECMDVRNVDKLNDIIGRPSYNKNIQSK